MKQVSLPQFKPNPHKSMQNNTAPEQFKQVQYRFTQHIRDPDNQPAPADVEDRRMAIYRDLLYRNVEGFIADGFPVLRKIIKDEDWHAMIRDYFKRHNARTPYFPKLTKEFIEYLEHERQNNHNDYPFTFELAHYEWVESVIIFDHRAIPNTGIDRDGDLLHRVPVINPLIIPLAYTWPVHKISRDYLPTTPPEIPTYLLIYRNRNHEHGFIELNPVSAKLIEYLQTGEQKTGYDILISIANQLEHPNPEAVLEGGLDIMRKFLEKDILLGTRI